MSNSSRRGTAEAGVFIWRDGWTFQRLSDATVRIRHEGAQVGDKVIVLEADVPAAEWASIVHHMSAHDDAESMAFVTQFHRGVTDLAIPPAPAPAPKRSRKGKHR